MFFTHNKGVHGSWEITKPNTTQQEEFEEFEEFEVAAVAGRKYIDGLWMNLAKWKDWEILSWVWVENIAGYIELVNKWNAAHPVPADHPSK